MRRALLAAGAAAVLVALAGCTGPSQDPVPTVASDPYVCAGVQRDGAELTLGGEVTAERESGTWGGSPTGFNCSVHGPSGIIQVNEQPVGARTTWGTDAPAVLATLADQGDAARVTADAPGDGYVYGPGNAGWVCGERFLLVALVDVDTDGRDHRADAESLLVSMLPWACDGAEVPS